MLRKVVVTRFYKQGQQLIAVARLVLCVVLPVVSLPAFAAISVNKSTTDLEYGVILLDYFQQDYFSALIEQEYAQAINNTTAKSPRGQVLKGGMMLSYGMADEAKRMFDTLLDSAAPEEVKNRAWFYLAKLFYSKSDVMNARESLAQIRGKMPDDLHTDYHYLATLLNHTGNHLGDSENKFKAVSKENPYFPYLLFNMAILQLKDNKLEAAVGNLEAVTKYSGVSEELSLLSDRARHGLAELALQHGNLMQAWLYLKDIRTTGLYSNRALLSYAWAAINLKQYRQAIPALELLNERSIAIPEVQEAKVLLAHVYEQEGAPRKALKRNLIAEKEFHEGVEMIAEARRVIEKQDVPREFIKNLDAMMDDSDWYSTRPSVDYQKLTPFLIDLMASHPFHETLRELADLYAIEANLKYWSIQANEHLLILENANKKKNFDASVLELVKTSAELNEQFADQNTELRLHSLALNEQDQDRLKALIETTERELKLLDGKVAKLKDYKRPYEQPAYYKKMVAEKHREIERQLAETEKFVQSFETIMRGLVKVELDKHEERMRYYAAQSKLAKARLYDMTLLSLEKAKSTVQDDVGADAQGDE
ncbi:hypothetical protein ACSV5M_11265 [Cellvibrio sp. ARAG 10.3]|uniref:tetratricopeptide repeat protein n=1 Tax=Cellvibrio sp. ARAG 10.3 TaxID=3451358 RepID=UPI003F47017D